MQWGPLVLEQQLILDRRQRCMVAGFEHGKLPTR